MRPLKKTQCYLIVQEKNVNLYSGGKHNWPRMIRPGPSESLWLEVKSILTLGSAKTFFNPGIEIYWIQENPFFLTSIFGSLGVVKKGFVRQEYDLPSG